ncbi:MAG TPA: lysophospholipid acyltransferase family protein [Actinomycetota bacterium]|nr:lysophospholipid acyltransferase family protein [Actinomycetota bacterium]
MREPVEALFSRYSWPTVRLLKWSLRTGIRPFYRLRVQGAEHVPPTGPGIVAANHVSLFDAAAVQLAVRRRLTALAKAEYWKSRRTRWIFDLTGQIPVERGSDEASASVEAGLRVLALGGLLHIHPEGSRSPDGRMYRGKSGVGRLAAQSGAPVIPTAVLGTLAIFPRHAKRPRLNGRVTVRFAPAVCFPSADPDDPAALHAFVDDVMARIRDMSGQEYVDEYNDAPAHAKRATRPGGA